MTIINLFINHKLIFMLGLSLNFSYLISMEQSRNDTIIDIDMDREPIKNNSEENQQISDIIQELKKLETPVKRRVNFSDTVDNKNTLIDKIERAAKKKKTSELTLLLQQWAASNSNKHAQNLIAKLEECTNRLAKIQEDSEKSQKAAVKDSEKNGKVCQVVQATVTLVVIAFVLAVTEVVKREI